MNVFVAFKFCPNLDRMKQSDYVLQEEMGIDTHFLPNILNCYDESSLELVLRLSEKQEHLCKTAFTIGPKTSDQVLDSLLALGYEHAVRVESEKDTRFKPEIIAATIYEYLTTHPQDLILLGREAPLGNNAATAQLVAAALDVPLISSVVDFSYRDEKSISVDFQHNGSLYRQEVSLPCVFSIGNAEISKLRMPTLRQRMKAKSCFIEYAQLSVIESSLFPDPIEMRIPDRHRTSTISQQKGRDAVYEIFENVLKKRLEEL